MTILSIHQRNSVNSFCLQPALRARVDKTAVQKLAPRAEHGRWFEIKQDLVLTDAGGSELTVPAGAFVKLGEVSQEDGDLEIACDFLQLSSVKKLLEHMKPVGLFGEEAEKVLTRLDKLGILVWIDEPDLRDLVMLNPRKLAVAMAKLMAVCFGFKNFDHKDFNLERTIGDVSKNYPYEMLRVPILWHCHKGFDQRNLEGGGSWVATLESRSRSDKSFESTSPNQEG